MTMALLKTHKLKTHQLKRHHLIHQTRTVSHQSLQARCLIATLTGVAPNPNLPSGPMQWAALTLKHSFDPKLNIAMDLFSGQGKDQLIQPAQLLLTDHCCVLVIVS